MTQAPFEFNGVAVTPGTRTIACVPLPGLYTDTEMNMPVHIVHGRHPGPVIFISAAVHGDEINGVEIIRRLLLLPTLKRIAGTLLLVPVVNLYGFQGKSRYLPDRRDLNRSFPGSDQGSMAARLAHAFLAEVAGRCDLGIDLHTAAIHRDNLPQIRADMNDAQLSPLAHAFAAPVLIHSAPPAGSLRYAGAQLSVPIMVYEAGEALRFDEASIRVGTNGILNVMRACGMLKARRKPAKPSVLLRSTRWVRAPRSGILRTVHKLGDLVKADEPLGLLSDPIGREDTVIPAPYAGVVIGRSHLPLVYEGEALFHIGRTPQTSLLEAHLDALNDTEQLANPELVEEPEIV